MACFRVSRVTVLVAVLLLAGVASAYRQVDCTYAKKNIPADLEELYYDFLPGVMDSDHRVLRSALEFDAMAFFAPARYGGVDIAEFLVTAQRVAAAIAPANVTIPGVVAQWESIWSTLGLQVYNDSLQMAQNGDAVGANEALARAATYYQLSERFSDHLLPASIAVFNKSMEWFYDAVSSGAGIGGVKCSRVQLPYTDAGVGAVTLLGVWCPAPASAAHNASVPPKTIVAVNGFDGSVLNSFYEVAAPAVLRGFSVLAFDGPGQGSAARHYRALFRPDWEVVVSVAMKWLYANGGKSFDPEAVTLWGRSFGGYLAPRAFVSTPPSVFTSLVADGGVVDMFQNALCQLPSSLQEVLASDPARFNDLISPGLNTSLPFLNIFRWGQLGFNVSTLSDFFLAWQPYELTTALTGAAGRPVFVNNPALDTSTWNQSSLFWDELVNSSTIQPLNAASTLVTQDPLRGTGLHCDVGSTANTIGTILRWIEVNGSN